MLPTLLMLGASAASATEVDEADAWRLSEAQRFRDLQLASGLLGSQAERDQAKYNPTAGTMPAFPNGTAGTFFSGVFSDHVVLQRGPSKAAVFGVVFGAETATEVDVTVASVSGSGDVTDSYSVKAAVMLTGKTYPGGRYAQWKAFLKPAPAGGNFTITAGCSSCKNTTAKARLADVTFGDVWFCSGQSNMWLPMNMDTSRNNTYDAILRGKYKNIRMHSQTHNNQPDGGVGGIDLDIAPPPPEWHWRHQHQR